MEWFESLQTPKDLEDVGPTSADVYRDDWYSDPQIEGILSHLDNLPDEHFEQCIGESLPCSEQIAQAQDARAQFAACKINQGLFLRSLSSRTVVWQIHWSPSGTFTFSAISWSILLFVNFYGWKTSRSSSEDQ